MDLFYRSESQKKTYKLVQEKDQVYVYWVSVYASHKGTFLHARGRDVVESLDKGRELLEYMGEPCEEKDYINALKDYFKADKETREQFVAFLESHKKF